MSARRNAYEHIFSNSDGSVLTSLRWTSVDSTSTSSLEIAEPDADSEHPSEHPERKNTNYLQATLKEKYQLKDTECSYHYEFSDALRTTR